ncbi:MAG: phosphatase PAP2 family protein [Candidatus Doudnabacteria bacterium]
MQEKNKAYDFRSTGYFGENPLLGLLIGLAGALIFVLMALNLILHGPLINLDVAVAIALHNIALKTPAWIIKIMIDAYYFGKQGTALFAYAIATYFLFKAYWRELVMSIVTFAPLGFLFLFLSHIFVRPRPFLMFDKPIWPGSPNIPGFPSGHSLSIFVLCGFLVYIIAPKLKTNLGKNLVILTGIAVVFFISFSRLLVGDHYLTDILAGYGAGLAWLALMTTLVELVFKKLKK